MNYITRRRFLLQSAVFAGGGVVSSCKGGDERKVAESPATFEAPAVAAPADHVVPPPGAVVESPHRTLTSMSEITGNWTFRGVTGPSPSIDRSLASLPKPAPATVPGTVLTSMINNKVYPEPLYRQIVTSLIDDDLHKMDYRYETSIDVPELEDGQRFWLRFDGINYLADIRLEAKLVGRIEGAFKRGFFDVTDIVRDIQGEKAQLEVLIHQLDYEEGPALPSFESGVTRGGRNGGGPGITLRNGPTFFCTAGWDWVPTIPDRCLGIWQPVYSFTTGACRIADVRVEPQLSADLSAAELTLDVTIGNAGGAAETGTIVGRIGDIEFRHEVGLPSDGATKTVRLTSAEVPQLRLVDPKLWWPNGYGDPYLYPLSIALDVGGITSDVRELKFGVRSIQYSRQREGENELAITVNNLPILIMGGNWGLDEALKRIPRDRIFNQVRMQREANLNLIRNWNGQSTSKDLFEACDEYGILIWQDFFFSTEGEHKGKSAIPWSEAVINRYLDNVRDVIVNYRNHPSVLLWCGGNEGPPSNEDIRNGLEQLVGEHDPNRETLTSSAGDTAEKYSAMPLGGYSSGGPYHWVNPQTHFDKVAGSTGILFHNEIGSYSVPTLEFVQSMIPEKSWQKPDDYWADRDINGNGGNSEGIAGATSQRYGQVASLADFCRKAQLMNYECIKAIYESHAANFGPVTTAMPAPSTGVMMWMTNPAQPSFVWQMYSHDLEQHSSFFAVQHGSRRMHVIMNALTRDVMVVNHSAKPLKGSLEIGIYNLNGTISSRTVQIVRPLPAASSARVGNVGAKIRVAASPVCFVSLRLSGSDGKVLSENFYWYETSGDDSDYTALETAPPAALSISAKSADNKGVSTLITATVKNSSDAVALMTHLQVYDKSSGLRILPAFYSDNYLNLLPQASRQIVIDLPYRDGKPVANPAIRVDGWKLDREKSRLDQSGVPVSFNENALAIETVGAGFGA
jgi:mannosylglycoprotein endo-beta-mannosidase